MNVLYLYLGQRGQQKNAFCHEEAEEQGVHVTALALPNELRGFRRVMAAFMVPLPSEKYDAVVTTEYFIGFGVNLRLYLSHKKIKHIVFGINQSARLLSFRYAFVNKWINRVFNRADQYVTYSRAEMDLFNQLHDIDKSKFTFSHWGFDLPKVKQDKFANPKKDYIAFVGRNNRDLKTFCQAIEGMSINGVIITAAYNAPDFPLPKNVEIFYDLGMEDCMSCIRHAKMNAVLVNDDDRGAGHITIVAAMLMGKPQIISQVTVVQEYFVDGVHGVSVPIGDSDSVKRAITQLQDRTFYHQCSQQAEGYAKRYFTNAASAKRFVGIVQSVVNNKSPNACDPVWLNEYNSLRGDV